MQIRRALLLIFLIAPLQSPIVVIAQEEQSSSPLTIQITEKSDWRLMDGDDFVRVNGDEKTLVWEGTNAFGSGLPIGVTRSKQQFKNFELSIEWMHKELGGNSGVFAWVDPLALEGLPPGQLPESGIEIQMLDHGYAELYKTRTGRDRDFFTTNGDVFAVGKSTMKPFPPLSPNGSRSFPSSEHSFGFGNWNHYYVRGINGQIRLWVNGHEVSGGDDCQPAEGFLCLESEGAPIDFRNLQIRELP